SHGWSYRKGPAWFVLVALLALGGCTRPFFRKQADKEVEATLAEKDVIPDWKIEQYHVYADPHARFADPTNPDFPPMPPDDPAAYDLAPRSQKPGKSGISLIEGTGYVDLLAMWDAQNRQEAEAAKAKPNAEEKAPVTP